MVNTDAGATRLKRFIPARIKTAIKNQLREQTFKRAMKALTSLPVGKPPSRTLLSDLQKGWGNEAFAARIDYLEEIASRALRVNEPILECGAGLSTIIIGWLAGRRGVKVTTFEHIQEWQERISGTLRRYNIPGVDICLTPLRDYGEFAWYELPDERLPPEFGLVICDGPPGTTKGNRVGLLPVMAARLRPGCVVLLDDAEREGEKEVLRRWATIRSVNTEIKTTVSGTFAVVTIEPDVLC